jgi:hypothetical protein
MQILLEVTSHSATEEFSPNVLWNPQVHYRVHNSCTLVPVVIQMTSRFIYLLTQSLPLYAFTVSRLFFFHFDHFTDGRTPWTRDQLVARPLPKHTINTYTYQRSIPCVGLEPTIPASERSKTIHALDRSATVSGPIYMSCKNRSTSIKCSGTK